MWFRAYVIAWLLSGVGGAIYATYSRPYIAEHLGVMGYSVVGFLLAAERIPSLASVFTGYLADVVGRKKLLLLGLARLPVYALMGLVNPLFLPVLVFVNSTLSSVIAPSIVGTVLHATRSSGFKYSLLATMTTIGWILGGIIPGLLEPIIGSLGLFLLAGILVTTSIVIQYVFYPNTTLSQGKTSIIEVLGAIRKTSTLGLSVVLANAAVGFFYTVLSLRVYSEVKSLLAYGLIVSTSTAIANSMARPVAGKLVDRYNPLTILVFSVIAYIALNTSIYFSTGIVMIVLWALPVYPFRDTATIIALSRSMPSSLQSTAAGLNMALNSLAGIVILALASISSGNIALVYVLHIILLITALLLLTRYRKRVAWKHYD